MKKYVIILSVLLLSTLLYLESCRGKKEEKTYHPIRSSQFASDKSAEPLFVKNQLIVFYKNPPTAAAVNAIKRGLIAMGIKDSVTIRRCNSCSTYAELWTADSIHTGISTEGVVAGSGGGGSHGVGEDSIASYSLNFIMKPPVEQKGMQSSKEILSQSRGDNAYPNGTGKDTILVAVLDTGIDTLQVVHPAYLWTNKNEKNNASDPDGNCYPGDRKGWNFVTNSPDIREDHTSLHGSLVSKYIIDAVQAQSKNFIQVMALKTHDSSGYGDLFSSICALHYAIDKGANIINASWGFYYYEKDPHPYLSELITKKLADKGILFITAAGNKMDDADTYAKDLYQQLYGEAIPDTLLRNLAFHNFYPACLSDSSNNVVTITTNDSGNVSPTQNFNSTFVNSGVLADTVFPGSMKFKLPFPRASGYISGSSFATAIFTGRLAASFPKANYTPGIKKSRVLQWLEQHAAANTIPLEIVNEPVLESRKRIDRGRYIRKI
jgi:hypothetical protein